MTSDWIYVKDQMPEVNVPVLCYGRGHNKKARILVLGERTRQSWRTCYWNEAEGRGAMAHPYNEDGSVSDEDITHWTPLPDPPKEEANVAI